MNLLEEKTLIVVGGILVISVGAAWAIKKAKDGLDAAGGAGGLAEKAAGAAVEAAAGAATGTVLTVGDVVGLPRTSTNECQACIDEFRAAPWYKKAYLSFKVSANCTASDYLTFVGTQRGPLDEITPADRNATSGGSRGFY